MAYVPGCRYDLFISYASENNRDGWVEQFEKALAQELGDLLGRQFSPKDSVFFDKRQFQVTQSFPDELAAAVRNSAILIPILSPHYVTSPWCNRERTEFFSKLGGGTEPANCLAPIVVRPIDPIRLSPHCYDAKYVSFLNPDGQTPLSVGSPQWNTRLRELARQIKNALQSLRRNCKPIFLGKIAEAEQPQKLRTWLQTELERRYFRVAPETLPVLEDSDLARAHLQAAGLAIHFLGGADPRALEAIEASVAVCTGATILYQPFGVNLTVAEGAWLESFERDLQPPPGGYQRLAGKNEEELLALIDEQITRVQADSGTDIARVKLVLICEKADFEGVWHLKEEIEARRPITVEFPDFLDSPLTATERLRKWHDYLGHGERLLFYYGAAERSRLELLWQTARQCRPGARLDWFLAPPALDEKRRRYPDALWNMDQVSHFIGLEGQTA